MKEFVISEAKTETAILVGLITQRQDEKKTNEYLDELEFLAETAGAKVVRRFTQKLVQAHAVTYVGEGKLQEIEQYIKILDKQPLKQAFNSTKSVNISGNQFCCCYHSHPDTCLFKKNLYNELFRSDEKPLMRESNQINDNANNSPNALRIYASVR